MIRILGFLIGVALLVGGAVWLAEHPGLVTVRWMAWRLDTSVPILVLTMAIVLVVGYFTLRFLFGVLGLPGWLSRRSRERRQMKGSAALAGAVTAIAGGDADAAKRCTKDADKALKNPQLTHLLTAQIDATRGDVEAAKAHYQALLETPDTELAGLRGLLDIMDPADANALPFAEKAIAKAPKAAWAIRALFAAQVAAGRLDAAQSTLSGAKKNASFSDAEKGQLALKRAQQAQDESRFADATKLAREALDLMPGDLDAVLTLAMIHRADNRQKKAVEVLETQWKAEPSAKVLSTYMGVMAAVDPDDVLKAVRKLTAANPDHAESRLALANALLGAGNLAEAKQVIEPLVGPEAEAAVAARACLTMARVLVAEGADVSAQKDWIDRAALGLAGLA